MRHLRRTALAALAIALYAAPAARADDSHNHSGASVTPSNGKLLGESWAQLYSLPVSENPFAGNGNPCLTVGHKIIRAVGGASCTVKEGTALTLGFGTACSNVEPPPSYGADEAAQRACALANDQSILAAIVTVDGGRPVDIHRRRFESFSPQRTVQLPADNILGVPAQTATLTAHGWEAVVRKLRPGRHTIVGEAVFPDGTLTVPHILTVLPCRHCDKHDRDHGHPDHN